MLKQLRLGPPTILVPPRVQPLSFIVQITTSPSEVDYPILDNSEEVDQLLYDSIPDESEFFSPRGFDSP